MAYDEALAGRVRDRLAGESGVEEKRMFGGLAFLLGGSMSVGVRGADLMVRVGSDGADDALARPHARRSYMGEREMKGWILVAPEGLESDEALGHWVRRGLAHARSLPPKG
ncbi:TfoX/Sxy family protein [Candidatus Solirubrobacter pratensis]|uniref:TfoX/Sxy family protein n=1 Tax=Candidatus Solirubrobacter pratensis TaxID=1298857 RepID=UPI00042335E9|nr:TfoX/Sxy family protein [Candidatus Solirubrobacter pratensis]